MAAGRAGGTAPTVFNAANEVAVAAFLEGAIPFGRISETIERRARRAYAHSGKLRGSGAGRGSWARSRPEQSVRQ